MSPPMKILFLVIALIVGSVAFLAFYVYGGEHYVKPETEEGAPPRAPLLERAITALGGASKLGTIRSVRSRARAVESGRRSDLRIHVQLEPDRYRHDVDTGDAHFVHGFDGTEMWATLDGVPAPVPEDDVKRMEEQMLLGRCGLLVGLKESEDIEVEELGVRDELEWLKVTFSKESAGPFLLGFDKAKALLRRVEWKSKMPGNLIRSDAALDLDDYRAVDGVMVAFALVIRVSDKVVYEEALVEIRFNEPVGAELFRQPAAPAQSPIIKRDATELHAAYLDFVPGDAEDAERILTSFISEFDLARNGPSFRMIENERPIAVGVPVQRPQGADKIPARAKAPRLHEVPKRSVLTTIVSDPTPETLRAAEKRLLAEAGQTALAPGGPFRHVAWKENIVQVQLPVTPR